MTNIFQRASKSKLRFTVPGVGGMFAAEDLWDLPMEDLDKLAIGLKHELESSVTESFIKKATSANTALKLRFEIAKAIIESRLEAADRKEKAAVRKARRDTIRAAIATKENEEILDSSKDDLYAMLDEEDEADEADEESLGG